MSTERRLLALSAIAVLILLGSPHHANRAEAQTDNRQRPRVNDRTERTINRLTNKLDRTRERLKVVENTMNSNDGENGSDSPTQSGIEDSFALYLGVGAALVSIFLPGIYGYRSSTDFAPYLE